MRFSFFYVVFKKKMNSQIVFVYRDSVARISTFIICSKKFYLDPI